LKWVENRSLKWGPLRVVFPGLFAVALFASCTSRHSIFEDAEEHFRNHRPAILEVRDGLLDSDYVRIIHGGLTGGIAVQAVAGGPEEIVTSKEADNLRYAMERAGVDGVYSLEGDIYFLLPSGAQGRTHYTLRYCNRRSGAVWESCSEIIDSLECGWCSEPIEDDWSILVTWRTLGRDGRSTPECSAKMLGETREKYFTD
jgi:hypothetical protein